MKCREQQDTTEDINKRAVSTIHELIYRYPDAECMDVDIEDQLTGILSLVDGGNRFVPSYGLDATLL